MEKMNITFAQYMNDMDGNVNRVRVSVDDKDLFVPLDPANRHYAEILRQVEAGELTIAEAV